MSLGYVLKKLIFTCLWVLLIFFGTCLLIGFAGGFLVVFRAHTGTPPSSNALKDVFKPWMFYIPYTLGAVGLVFGILGLLPGTRRKVPFTRPESQRGE